VIGLAHEIPSAGATCRHAPPQFVREVQEHDDLVLLLGGLGGPCGDHHRDALALGGRDPNWSLSRTYTIAMVFSVAVSASCRVEWQRKTSYVFMPFGD
jgi:hypothetical protein